MLLQHTLDAPPLKLVPVTDSGFDDNEEIGADGLGRSGSTSIGNEVDILGPGPGPDFLILSTLTFILFNVLC